MGKNEEWMPLYYPSMVVFFLYLVIVSNFLNSRLPTEMQSFMFIEYDLKLGYPRWCYVKSFFVLYYSPQEDVPPTWAWSSGYELTELILFFGCPYYNLTSSRKSTIVHKPSTQSPNAFNRHDTAGKTKYLVTNTLVY